MTKKGAVTNNLIRYMLNKRLQTRRFFNLLNQVLYYLFILITKTKLAYFASDNKISADINPFVLNAPFIYPLKTSKNPKVF